MQRIALGADLAAGEASSLAMQLQGKASLYAAEAEKKAQVSPSACMPDSLLTAGMCNSRGSFLPGPAAAEQGCDVRC